MKKLLVLLFFLCPQLALAQSQQQPSGKLTYNGSVVIVTGNTFQAIAAANAARSSLTIQNNNATDSCWITFGKIGATTITAANAAKASSILLLAGGSYTRYFPYTPSDEIEGTCASNSDTMYVDVQ